MDVTAATTGTELCSGWPQTQHEPASHTHTQRSEKRLERRIPAQLMHNTERVPNKTISKQAGKVKQNSSSRCREAPNAGAFSPDADLLCHEMARPPGLLGPNLRCRLSLRKCSGEKTYDVLLSEPEWKHKIHFAPLVYCDVCTALLFLLLCVLRAPIAIKLFTLQSVFLFCFFNHIGSLGWK